MLVIIINRIGKKNITSLSYYILTLANTQLNSVQVWKALKWTKVLRNRVEVFQPAC